MQAYVIENRKCLCDDTSKYTIHGSNKCTVSSFVQQSKVHSWWGIYNS